MVLVVSTKNLSYSWVRMGGFLSCCWLLGGGGYPAALGVMTL